MTLPRSPLPADATEPARVIADPASPAQTVDEIAPQTFARLSADAEHAIESHEPCPTPLDWREVLERFRADASAWEITRGNYALRGKTWGNGPPLYFLGGVTGSCELFALLIWLLKDDYRCVVFDYPDDRAKNEHKQPLTLNDYADDVRAISDHHGDSSISLYATSMGVPISLALMAEHPSLVERAMLQGGATRLPLTLLERGAIRCASYLPGKLRHLPGREAIWSQNHRAWFPPFDWTRWQFFDRASGDSKISTIMRRLLLLANNDLSPLLPRVAQPVLLIGTEGEGPRMLARREELARGLPNSTTELLDTTGLFPYLTHPHRLKKIIANFITNR